MFVIAAVVIAAFAGCREDVAGDATKAAGLEPAEKVELAMHVMSQCPFGVQVENAVQPVQDQLGKALDLKVYFIGDEKDGQLTSMHGANEVAGDLQHVCAMKYAPDAWLALAVCQNKNMKDIPNNFDACAAAAKLDAAKIKACAGGDEGRLLLKASFDASKQKKASGSPTIFLAGEKYQGGRQTNDFLRAVCGKFTKARPEACKNIPEPKKVDLTILTDARCKDCAPDRFVGQFKSTFPGLNPKTLDYGTPEGNALYATLKGQGAGLLPAFLFAAAVAEDPGYTQIQRFAKDVGPYKLVQMGAKFDPTAEICDNTMDDDGNGKADCQDDGCKGKIVCREATPKQLDVFVMSQCPFGVKALNAMKEVLEAFKDDGISFRVNFIAEELPDGSFKALHGQPEVDENIRELCAIKLYPQVAKATGLPKYMDYILCRNADIRGTDWQKCATGGIDAKKMEACVATDGKKLHAANIKLAKELGIGASPTWLANNKEQFSGVAPDAIKQAFCKANAGLKGCSKTLSGTVAAPAGGGGSCGGGGK